MTDRPKPCENAFRACSAGELEDWVACYALDNANLSLALEILGAHGARFAPRIAYHVTHESPLVREGALLGLRNVVQHMERHDPSPGIRRAAGDWP